MRPKVLRIRFLPVNDIAIQSLAMGRRQLTGRPDRCPNAHARPGATRAALAIPTPKPGVRYGSHPGSVISKLGAAPSGRRRALMQVVADLPYFDSRARFFKLLFDFIRLFLVDPFLDRLRRRLDKVLRLLEAEAGDRPHLLDDVDLLLAERRSGSRRTRSSPRPPRQPPHRRRRRPRPRPARRRKRPTSPQASSPAPPPRARSAPTNPPPVSSIQPFLATPAYPIGGFILRNLSRPRLVPHAPRGPARSGRPAPAADRRAWSPAPGSGR